MSVLALRQQLAAILAPPRVGGGAAIPTGIAVLDRALSYGGLPCGQLTEIQGARGSGRTTLVRQLVTAAVTARRWVAIVDGSRTLAPREWAEAGDSGRLWVIRPPDADRSAWCADILLRSSAFSLVVLDSAPALPRPVAIRLTRLAKEHDVALVVVGDHPVIGSAVRMRVKRTRADGQTGRRAASSQPGDDSRFTIHDSPVSAESRVMSHESLVRQPHITIHVDKGGQQHAVEVSCVIEMARRLHAHSEVPDRRGVATRNRRGEKVASPHRRESGARTAPHEERESERENEQPPVGTTLPRKRRFAEAWARNDGLLLREGGQKAEARRKRKVHK